MKRAFATRINHLGFTMIELVIVLIVMAIVAVFIASRASTSGNDLIAETDILKSHLRYAQIRAMNDSVPWGIHIPDAGSYVLYRDNKVDTDQMLPGEKPGVQKHTFLGAVTVTSGVGTTYNFNQWGTPVDASGSAISANQSIALSEGTATNAIAITRNTGFIP
jgi:prepilin-type N-terminal cleavage/methylation domain-containing protein